MAGIDRLLGPGSADTIRMLADSCGEPTEDRNNGLPFVQTRPLAVRNGRADAASRLGDLIDSQWCVEKPFEVAGLASEPDQTETILRPDSQASIAATPGLLWRFSDASGVLEETASLSYWAATLTLMSPTVSLYCANQGSGSLRSNSSAPTLWLPITTNIQVRLLPGSLHNAPSNPTEVRPGQYLLHEACSSVEVLGATGWFVEMTLRSFGDQEEAEFVASRLATLEAFRESIPWDPAIASQSPSSVFSHSSRVTKTLDLLDNLDWSEESRIWQRAVLAPSPAHQYSGGIAAAGSGVDTAANTGVPRTLPFPGGWSVVERFVNPPASEPTWEWLAAAGRIFGGPPDSLVRLLAPELDSRDLEVLREAGLWGSLGTGNTRP